MALTKAMRVRQAFPDDFPVIQEIAAANGLTGFRWPRDAWGAIATIDDRTVAFCAGSDRNDGIFIEELWSTLDTDGVRGLSKLAEWVEGCAAKTARITGGTVRVGGVVFKHNERHGNALRRRGYSHYADILSKEISAHG